MRKLLKFREWCNKFHEDGIPIANAKNEVLNKLKELFKLTGMENDTQLTRMKFSELKVKNPKEIIKNSALYQVSADDEQKQQLDGLSPVDTTIQDVVDIMAV
jgi:hypothetical protein